MAWLTGSLGYIVPFLAVLTVLVFVHELGHYLAARRNGVKAEIFSIGFGPEPFGWNDRAGTRWKLSVVPLGGYIKMFGDVDAASMPSGAVPEMTAEERAISFHHKRLLQRVEIVAAGPIANFVFAMVVLSGLFMTIGQPVTPTDVGEVLPGSAAERAGIQPHDVILAVNGTQIERFEDIQQIVALNEGTELHILVRRGDRALELNATPWVQEEK